MRHWLIVVCVVCLGVSRSATGDQADLKATMAQAEACMTDYAVARSDLPTEAVCKVRSQLITVDVANGNVTNTDEFILWAANRETREFYFANGEVSGADVDPRRKRYWEQTLRTPEQWIRTNGSGTRVDRVTDLTVKEPEPMKPTYSFYDPFSLPVASEGAYSGGSVGADYVLVAYVLNAKLIHAERDIQENVVGIWEMGDPGVIVEITFGKASGNMPTRMLRKFREKRDETLETARKRPPILAGQTTWKESVSGTEKLWLPVRVQNSLLGANGRTQADQQFCFEWKLGDAAKVTFPSDINADWRKPFLALFDDDPLQLFDPESCRFKPKVAK